MSTLHKVTLHLCSLCIDGAGGECHTPGCAMWLNRAPDLSLRGHPCVLEIDGQPGSAYRAAFAQPAPAVPPCTGLTAVWCPVHGDCACPPNAQGAREPSDDFRCPLHAFDSPHAEGDPAPAVHEPAAAAPVGRELPTLPGFTWDASAISARHRSGAMIWLIPGATPATPKPWCWTDPTGDHEGPRRDSAVQAAACALGYTIAPDEGGHYHWTLDGDEDRLAYGYPDAAAHAALEHAAAQRKGGGRG